MNYHTLKIKIMETKDNKIPNNEKNRIEKPDVNKSSGNYNRESYSSKSKSYKATYITLGIALLIIAVTGSITFYLYSNNKENNFKDMLHQNMQLSEQLNDRDSLINEWVQAFNEIEKDIATIKEKENILNVKSDDQEFSKDRRVEILDDIKYINSLLEANKKKIWNLNYRLKKSGVKITALESKINDLENSLNMRDSSINILKDNLAQKDFEMIKLNELMGELETKVNEQNIVMNSQTAELNKAYLAYGTYKELKEKGVLTKDGGFLWIGQEKTLKENFNENNFTEINILKTTKIPVETKSLELITHHPKGSYDIVMDSTHTIAYLEIKDPVQFWKVSKYAVLETKN